MGLVVIRHKKPAAFPAVQIGGVGLSHLVRVPQTSLSLVLRVMRHPPSRAGTVPDPAESVLMTPMIMIMIIEVLGMGAGMPRNAPAADGLVGLCSPK